MASLTFSPLKSSSQTNFISFPFRAPSSLPTKISCHKKLSLPPGPRKLPLIGNLHNLIGSLPHHVLKDLAKEYGPLVHLQLGEVSAVVVSSPKMAYEVMKLNDDVFAQRPEILAAKIFTYGNLDLVFSKGQYWKNMRKICMAEVLGTKKVKAFAPLREDEASKLVELIRSAGDKPVNLSEMIFWMTSVIACRASFGDKMEDHDELIPIVRESVVLSGGFDLADLYPSLEFLHVITNMKGKIEKMHEKMDRALERIVKEHRESLAAGGKGEAEDELLVDVLLRLQESGKLDFPITDNNIKAVILDMFVAGTDTSSTTTEWAMSEMAKSPRILKKAQAEVRQALKGKKTIREEDIQELKYLKLVIKETLRLHPAVPLSLPRESNQRCVVDGYEIPEKTKVIVNAWAIGRDPEYWQDPESFIPERFIDNSIDFRGKDFEYIPFGAGKRICPGMGFGLANVELPLANLLYHFDWKMPDRVKPEDLDMTESFGATVGRKIPLCLIATPYEPLLEDSPQQIDALEFVK